MLKNKHCTGHQICLNVTFFFTTAGSCSPVPVDPPNGNVAIISGDGTAFGSVVQYRCDPGYQMQAGSPIVFCGENDDDNVEWSEGFEVECVGE